MVSPWMGDQSSADAEVKNTVKSQEWRNGVFNKNSRGQKKIYIYKILKLLNLGNLDESTNFKTTELRQPR